MCSVHLVNCCVVNLYQGTANHKDPKTMYCDPIGNSLWSLCVKFRIIQERTRGEKTCSLIFQSGKNYCSDKRTVESILILWNQYYQQMDFLFNLWANSHLSNWSWMYFPNRLLFSLRTVFAFPNASRMGFESRILCSILFTLAISSFLCGKGENVIYLGISLCHGVTKRKIAARHRKMSPTWKKASYLEFVKSVMKCISFRVVHVCKNNKASK